MGKWLSDETRASIVARYIAGESSTALSKSMGIPVNTILRTLARAGVKVADFRDRPRAAQKLLPSVAASIIEQYQAGNSLADIARDHGVHLQSIRGVLIREGVPRRGRGATFRSISDDQLAQMVEMWGAGASQTAIASHFGLTQTNVSRALRLRGLVVNPRRASGERHGSWKGGVGIQAHGYLYRRVEPNDPLFSMANTGGYVLEHRLVMARAIGRPLHKWETVHHIDGDKKHNDLKNLQLRIGRHGKGEVYECSICGSRNIRAVALD